MSQDSEFPNFWNIKKLWRDASSTTRIVGKQEKQAPVAYENYNKASNNYRLWLSENFHKKWKVESHLVTFWKMLQYLQNVM